MLKKGPKFHSVKIKENQKESIDKRLLSIYDLIRIDNNYRIRINSVLLRQKEMDMKQVSKIMKELFGHELKIASNNLYYFKSKKVYDYLHSFFIYGRAWEPITNEEEIQLLDYWNDVWLK